LDAISLFLSLIPKPFGQEVYELRNRNFPFTVDLTMTFVLKLIRSAPNNEEGCE